MYTQNEIKIIELDVQIQSLSNSTEELAVNKAFNEGNINSKDNQSIDPERNIEIMKETSISNEHSYQTDQLNKSDKDTGYKCNTCDEKLIDRYGLECHRILKHQQEKTHSCNQCDLKFVTKWRLNKHRIMHDDPSKRKCHYFNNDKVCPFVNDGCKFLHIESTECEFRQHCKRTMCQYRH